MCKLLKNLWSPNPIGLSHSYVRSLSSDIPPTPYPRWSKGRRSLLISDFYILYILFSKNSVDKSLRFAHLLNPRVSHNEIYKDLLLFSWICAFILFEFEVILILDVHRSKRRTYLILLQGFKDPKFVLFSIIDNRFVR